MKRFPVPFVATVLMLCAGPAFAQSELRAEPAQRQPHFGEQIRGRIALQHHRRALSAENERIALAGMRRALGRSPQASTPEGQAALEAMHRQAQDDARSRRVEALAEREALTNHVIALSLIY